MNNRLKFWHIPFTQPCFLCGATSRDGVFCGACDSSLPYLTQPHCPICALPIPSGEICGGCIQYPPPFKRTIAVFAYAFPLDKLIQALKYGEQLLLVNHLADKLTAQVDSRPDCILPMPLHPARLRERGFNQSLELARRVGKNLGIPVLTDACERVLDTPPQAALPWKERGKNMRRAFACTQDLSGKSVAVVDDVMTSGASLTEMALTLRNAGASEVSTWVVARTLPHAG